MKLLLAYLISLNSEWRGAKIRVITVIDDPEGKKQAEENIAKHMKEIRFGKGAEIIVREHPAQKTREIVHKYSKDADLVVLGMDEPKEGLESEYAEDIEELISPLGACLLIRNTESEELL